MLYSTQNGNWVDAVIEAQTGVVESFTLGAWSCVMDRNRIKGLQRLSAIYLKRTEAERTDAPDLTTNT